MSGVGCHARQMQLVGRDTEVRAIGAALDELSAGRSRVLLILGEAGIGKTRLLDVAISQARRRGFELRLGRATEHEGDVPLALFGESLGGAHESGNPESPPERWQLVRTLVSEFDRAPGDEPTVVALDDVHWGDPASLEVLDMLIRRPPSGAHVVLLALRPGVVADALATAARSAARPMALLELTPLTREQAAELVTGRPDAEAAAMFEASGGNPLLLTELHRSGGASMPSGIQAAVGAEVGRLSTPARALVEAGAVLGDPFDIDLASRTADLGQATWPAALDELVDRGLVVSAQSPRSFRFRHPVLRTAVHDAMSVGARLQAHERAAATLAGSGAAPPAIAHHLAHSAATGDVAAAATLREAAATVRNRAPTIAADWLLVAKRVAPPRGNAEFSELAQVLVQSGRLSEALDVVEEGMSLGKGSGDDQLALTLAAATVERQLGRHESARRRLVRVEQAHPHDDVPPELLAALALSAYESGDYEALAASAMQLEQVTSGELVLGAIADALLGMIRRFDGEASLSAQHVEQCLGALRDATTEELAARAELVTSIPWALMAIEEFAPAAETSRRAAAAARAAGNLGAAVALALPEALALALLGRLEEAEATAQEAELTARMTHNDQATQWALWVRAWVLLERGNLRQALAAATESVAIAERLDDSALATVSRTVLGAVLLAEGRPAEAAELIAAYDVEPTWICRWSPLLVGALLALGRREDAAQAARRASVLARDSGLRGAAAAAHRATCQVALAEGDLARAMAEALSAVDAAAGIGADHDRALAHLLAGRSAESDGIALDHFGQAHLLAERCGAGRTRDEAVRELRRRGRRVGRGGRRAPAGEGVAALSPREREIAELVAAGHTNREIAARLFLSEKTVESHLSKAFAKLDVTSRAALAALVAASASGPSGA